MANHRTVITLTPAENPKPRYASLEEAMRAAVPALAQLIAPSLTHTSLTPHDQQLRTTLSSVRERTGNGA